MKPLLAQHAPRLTDGVEPIREWKPAEQHLTHDGQVEFMARMKARIAAAEKARQSANENVKPITRRAKT